MRAGFRIPGVGPIVFGVVAFLNPSGVDAQEPGTQEYASVVAMGRDLARMGGGGGGPVGVDFVLASGVVAPIGGSQRVAHRQLAGMAGLTFRIAGYFGDRWEDARWTLGMPFHGMILFGQEGDVLGWSAGLGVDAGVRVVSQLWLYLSIAVGVGGRTLDYYASRGFQNPQADCSHQWGVSVLPNVALRYMPAEWFATGLQLGPWVVTVPNYDADCGDDLEDSLPTMVDFLTTAFIAFNTI